MRIRMRCALKRNAPALNFPPGRRRLSVRFRKPRRFAVCVWTSKGQPRREPLPHRHRRTYQTGYHRAGAFRAGCAGTRRSRAKRHGGILRRASDGFVFTQNGWVQSYGSRCVKPPVVIGDISRPAPITVEWAKYAQSLTDKPVKGC